MCIIDILIPPGVVSAAGGAAVVGASVVSKNVINTLTIIVESQHEIIPFEFLNVISKILPEISSRQFAQFFEA